MTLWLPRWLETWLTRMAPPPRTTMEQMRDFVESKDGW